MLLLLQSQGFEVGRPPGIGAWPGSVRFTRRGVLTAKRGAPWRVVAAVRKRRGVCQGGARGFVVR